MATTKIDVSACDNEIYLVAIQDFVSSELLHIKSGYGAPVSNVFNPGSVLLKGQYTLTMIGINWGGPAAFKVAVTTNGVTTNYPTVPVNSGVGVVWTQSIPMTV